MTSEDRRREDRELFNRIARKYSAKDVEPSSRAARQHRLLSSVAGLPALGRVLELGCGAGFGAEYLAGRYETYLGLDHSAELIAVAREHHRGQNVHFECGEVERFSTVSRFDTILMVGVLHHIPEPIVTLRRLHSWLAPGGCVVVNEPQRGNPLVSIARGIRKKIDPHYSADQVEFSRRELLQLFDRAGFASECFPQGVLSTPFAETAFLKGSLGLASSQLACRLDPAFEAVLSRARFERLAWNLIVQARLDASAADAADHGTGERSKHP